MQTTLFEKSLIQDKIILLDLNYTLVANSKECYGRYPERIYQQTYDLDLLNLIKDNYIILITARPKIYREDTLDHIYKLTKFQPEEDYWNWTKDYSVTPPQVKKFWLEKAVFPKHGLDGSKYLAIESNSQTRRMYSKFGIEAHPKKYFLE